MEIDTIVMIHTFDDGNTRFKYYNNEWKIKNIMYNGGKLELVNKTDNEVCIYSISSWKTRPVSQTSDTTTNN
jgi:hypothetical protein